MFAGFVARMEDTRLPKCVMFGEYVGGAGYLEDQEKKWKGCCWTSPALSASTPTSGQLQPWTRGNGAGRRNQGAECFMTKWITAEKVRAGLRHAVVCPNVTGRAKERIAQSKRALAGSLAIVD